MLELLKANFIKTLRRLRIMALREPVSMDECVYFTNRNIGKGKIRAWVFRENCPKCNKGLMGKPRDSKTGKAKIRTEEY